MPTNYTQINDYSDELGTTHGLHLDQDFTAVAASIATVTSSLSLVQRGDGRLQDVSVEIHTISPEVLNLMGGFNLRGFWAAATAYALNDIVSEGAYTYVCKTAHTSAGAFDDTNWIQFGFTSGADAATAAAAAQVSAASALASANTATTQAGIATSNASTTTTNASTSTTNATNASNSAIAAAASASAASGSAVAANASAVSATASAAAAAAVVAPAIHGATTKATPVDADELPMSDSAASWVIKKFTWANLKSVLKTYFDTLYVKLEAGAVIQRVEATPYSTYGSDASGSLPIDNTIPQKTEGASYVSLSFTPKYASSRLVIEGIALVGGNGSNNIGVFIADTAINNALSASMDTVSVGFATTIPVRADVSASSTSARTYQLRIGAAGGVTFFINGTSGGALCGGVAACRLSVTEIAG